MSAHTPGLWIRRGSHVDASASNESGMRSIAKCLPGRFSGKPLSGPEIIANARLIASAPDLLAALGQMVSHFEALDDGDGSLQQARAAIAKATQS